MNKFGSARSQAADDDLEALGQPNNHKLCRNWGKAKSRLWPLKNCTPTPDIARNRNFVTWVRLEICLVCRLSAKFSGFAQPPKSGALGLSRAKIRIFQSLIPRVKQVWSFWASEGFLLDSRLKKTREILRTDLWVAILMFCRSWTGRTQESCLPSD